MAWLRADLIVHALADLPPSARVLEVGAGQGAMGARLAERFDYTAVELDPASAAVAAQRIEPRGGRVVRQDLRAADIGTDFDALCAFEVLEHLEDDVAALRDWRDRLRPGGRVVLSVPVWQHRFTITDAHVGHHRRYDPPVLVERLAAAGFADISAELYGFPLGYALEAVRTQIAKRRPAPPDAAHGSAGSGRFLQPSAPFGDVTRLVTSPFRALHRPGARRGVGLVATARRPPDAPTA